jgi:hypothetical protein
MINSKDLLKELRELTIKYLELKGPTDLVRSTNEEGTEVNFSLYVDGMKNDIDVQFKFSTCGYTTSLCFFYKYKQIEDSDIELDILKILMYSLQKEIFRKTEQQDLYDDLEVLSKGVLEP